MTLALRSEVRRLGSSLRACLEQAAELERRVGALEVCAGIVQEALGVPIIPLSALEEQILRVLLEADRPLKGTALAARCGRPPNSYFRTRLAALVKTGWLVRHGRGGYALSLRRRAVSGDNVS